MRDGVGNVRHQRAALGVDLAALQAKSPVNAVRAVAEGAVGDAHRADAHRHAELVGPKDQALRRAADRVGAVGVAVNVAPGPVLPGGGQLHLAGLVVPRHVPVTDRPVRADAVERLGHEVRGVKPRHVSGVVNHAAADAVPGVVLAHFHRVLAADDALAVPVDVVRGGLVADPVGIGVPEGATFQHHHFPAEACQALRQDSAARARADDQQVYFVVIGITPHLALRHGAFVDMQELGAVVGLGLNRALEEPLVAGAAKLERIGGQRSGNLLGAGGFRFEPGDILWFVGLLLAAQVRFVVAQHLGVNVAGLGLFPGLALIAALIQRHAQAHIAARVGRAAEADLVPDPGVAVKAFQEAAGDDLEGPLDVEGVPDASRELAVHEVAEEAGLQRGRSRRVILCAVLTRRVVQPLRHQVPHLLIAGQIVVLKAVHAAARRAQLGVHVGQHVHFGFGGLGEEHVREGRQRAPLVGAEELRLQIRLEPRQHHLAGHLVPGPLLREHVVVGVAPVHLGGDSGPLARQIAGIGGLAAALLGEVGGGAEGMLGVEGLGGGGRRLGLGL